MCVCPECSARERMRKQCFLDIVSETVYKHWEIQSVQRLIVNSVVCLQVSWTVPTLASMAPHSFFGDHHINKLSINMFDFPQGWCGLGWTEIMATCSRTSRSLTTTWKLGSYVSSLTSPFYLGLTAVNIEVIISLVIVRTSRNCHRLCRIHSLAFNSEASWNSRNWGL